MGAQAEPIKQDLRLQEVMLQPVQVLRSGLWAVCESGSDPVVSEHNLYKYAINPTGYIDLFGLSDRCLIEGACKPSSNMYHGLQIKDWHWSMLVKKRLVEFCLKSRLALLSQEIIGSGDGHSSVIGGR